MRADRTERDTENMENQVKREKKRAHGIDRMKGILTLQMIAAHMIQFFLQSHPLTDGISNYVNLTTFSGFLFCFGYVCYLAYLKKDRPSAKILWGALKTLAAYVISGAAFWILVGKTPEKIAEMLLLQNMPGYAEFLMSFALVYVVVFAGFPFWKRLLESKALAVAVILLTLCYTLIPYPPIQNAVAASLIGSTKVYAFPLLAYFGYFLVGAMLARDAVRGREGGAAGKRIWPLLAAAAVGTASFLCYVLYHGGALPQRFPPSIWWVAGGAFPVCAYYVLTGRTWIGPADRFLEFVGKHTLAFLVGSNLVIFTVSWLMGGEKFL